jgi:hypothetical protein
LTAPPQVGYNMVLWDKHATPAGMACLLASIGFGSMYKQAPMRGVKGGAGLVTVELRPHLSPDPTKGSPEGAAGPVQPKGQPARDPAARGGATEQLMLHGWRGNKSWQVSDLVAVVGMGGAAPAQRQQDLPLQQQRQQQQQQQQQRPPGLALGDRQGSGHVSVSSEILVEQAPGGGRRAKAM